MYIYIYHIVPTCVITWCHVALFHFMLCYVTLCHIWTHLSLSISLSLSLFLSTYIYIYIYICIHEWVSENRPGRWQGSHRGRAARSSPPSQGLRKRHRPSGEVQFAKTAPDPGGPGEQAGGAEQQAAPPGEGGGGWEGEGEGGRGEAKREAEREKGRKERGMWRGERPPASQPGCRKPCHSTTGGCPAQRTGEHPMGPTCHRTAPCPGRQTLGHPPWTSRQERKWTMWKWPLAWGITLHPVP